MEQRKIKVTINPVGSPTIEAIGFTGGSCGQVTKTLEDVLSGSGQANERYLKPEWFQAEDTEKETLTW